jgi:hypothetical protein
MMMLLLVDATKPETSESCFKFRHVLKKKVLKHDDLDKTPTTSSARGGKGLSALNYPSRDFSIRLYSQVPLA